MIKLTQVSETGGDCTASYSVELGKEMTVKEFINIMLSERPTEWGTIEVTVTNDVTFEVDYSKGAITRNTMPEKCAIQKIKEIKAHGGYTSMCYYIAV